MKNDFDLAARLPDVMRITAWLGQPLAAFTRATRRRSGATDRERSG